MLAETVAAIQPLDKSAMEKCRTRLDNLTKPLGSLGSFEEMARKMAGITGQARLRELHPRLVVIDGDRRTPGVLDVFARHVGAEIVAMDKTAVTEVNEATLTEALNRGLLVGTAAATARVVGLGMTGELSPMAVTAVSTWFRDGDGEGMEILQQAGNLELAEMTGVILGAAAGGAVVVLDGLATGLAALIAVRLAPLAKEYLMASHFAAEPVHAEVLRLLDLPAYLYLGLHFGEGVGAALAISLLRASLHMLNDMKTFGEAQVHVAEDGPGSLVQNPAVRD
jgi:nicotinate-nucleotide--dimethylbenzimidazole phosphoribosyltransferase